MNFLILFLSVFYLMGCTTFSKQECASINWNQIAYQLGYNGSPKLQEKYAYYHAKCGDDHGIYPDKLAMEAGYSEGLRQYCTSDGGIRAGASGQRYAHICPVEKTADFMKTYNPARLAWLENENEKLRSENDRLENRYRSLQHEVNSLENQISSLRSEISSKSCP